MPADENAAFRLSVLYDLSLYISGCKDPVEILAGIVRHLRAVMPIEYAWLIIRRGDAFAELAVLGEDGETVLPGTRPVDNTIIESIVMQEFDGVVPDLPRWKQHNEDGFFPEGAGSAVICPVQRGKDADGCLIVASRRKEAYGRDQALLLFMLALQLGIVLRSLQLRQALEEQNARLAAIFDTLDEGLVLIDNWGSMMTANPALTRTIFPGTEPDRGQSWYAWMLGQKERFTPDRWLPLAETITGLADGDFPVPFVMEERGGKPGQPVLRGEYHLAGGSGSTRRILVILRDARETYRAEALRRDLTSMLVHDLRSPLGIINWNMELMLDGVLGEVTAEQERFLKGSIESTQELLDMIDSLLDIDRLETGALELDRSEIDLAVLAAEIAQRMDFVSHQLKLSFELRFEAGFPRVVADRQLVRRVLFNLFFNASKYAPQGSTIHVSGSSTPDWVSIAVEDEGKGIPEKYLDLIFDKYVQAEARNRGEIKGKGLGLTFCRLAVEAHGGRIRAENARGARFVFELPREGNVAAPKG
ncbi:MAG TPA: ATP-binding protein [Spirochaetota bacterium]|nr:ATP-binding protein [Spirochaetota bacterium]